MATPFYSDAKKAKAALNKQRKKAARSYLTDNYQPHEQDVLIGRGRLVENHKGNHRFKALIQAHLVAYYNAQTKATKTTIILRIFQDIKRTAVAEGGAGFIKRESSSKRWFVIEDSAARISIAQAFRDALASEYKSSKQYKQQKRKEQGRLCLQAQANMIMCSLGGNAFQQQQHGGPMDDITSNYLAGCISNNVAGSSTMTTGGILQDLHQTTQMQQQQQQSSLVLPPPPSLVPMVSSDGRDLSHRLRGILNTVSNVVAEDEDAEQEFLMSMATTTTTPVAAPAPQVGFSGSGSAAADGEKDLLSSLYSAIGGSSMALTVDPFEPTPMAEQEQHQERLDWGSTALTGGVLEASLVGDMVKAAGTCTNKLANSSNDKKAQEEQSPKQDQPIPSFQQIYGQSSSPDVRAALSA